MSQQVSNFTTLSYLREIERQKFIQLIKKVCTVVRPNAPLKSSGSRSTKKDAQWKDLPKIFGFLIAKIHYSHS